MYYHVKLTVDKPSLADAIRVCIENPKVSVFKITISLNDDSRDKFLLTVQQITRLQQSGKNTPVTITCFRDQIYQYAHSCIDKPTLLRIIAGENLF